MPIFSKTDNTLHFQKYDISKNIFQRFVSIGFKLDNRYPQQVAILKARGVEFDDGDKTHPYENKYPLTAFNEPICGNEYACRLVQKPFIQCVYLEDFDGEMSAKLNDGEAYIHEDAHGNASFQELNLQDKSCRFRLHYFNEC